MKKDMPHSNLLLVAIAALFIFSAQADTVGPFPYAGYFEQADQVIIARCTSVRTVEDPKPDQFGVVVRQLQATFRPSAFFKGAQTWTEPQIKFPRVEVIDEEKFKSMDSTDARMLLGGLERMINFTPSASYMIFLRNGKSFASIEVPTHYRP